MGQSKVPFDPDMPKEVRAFLDKMDKDLASITTTQIGAAGTTQADDRSGIIALPSNKDYRITERIPSGWTLTRLTTKTASGSCTVTLKINSIAVTGGAIATTSTQQSSTLTAANVTAEGDVLVITVSSNSSAVDLSFTIDFTRTLAN